MDELTEQVGRLVDQTRERCARIPAAASLEPALAAVSARLDEPLRVAIAGRVKAGKSTLLNALVGEQLAPTDAGECTKVVTWYRHGSTYRVTLDLHDGSSRPARFTRESGALDVDLGGIPAEAVERIVVEWPSKRLADLTLIDTPGVASLNTVVSDRAVAFLDPDDDRPVEADAVLYLMRHMHAADLSFLESFHDDELAHASPVNAIGLLSRADEIGVGRPNAMRVAERIAGRYRTDIRLRRLCQTVLPISGLVAETATTLTEDEFQALRQLSDLDRKAIDDLMLSADRFCAEAAPGGRADDPNADGGQAGTAPLCPVPPMVRRHLLERFGLYGIRISLPMIRQGRVDSALALAEALEARSGIVTLRQELLDRFAERRDVLRARSAMVAVGRLLHRAPPELVAEIRPEIERIQSGAHAFAEIRLLNDHRRGVVAFGENDTDEVDRLLGSNGTSPKARLGLPDSAGRDLVQTELLTTIDRWRRRGEHPLASRELSAAASVLVRTCEGALAQGSTEGPATGRPSTGTPSAERRGGRLVGDGE